MNPSEPVLAKWPAAVPVPERLRQLIEHMRGSRENLFADFELTNLSDDFMVVFFGGDDPALIERFPPKLAFFARDGGGGQVALWMTDDGPSDRWPVVHMDSEGGMDIVGEDIEDFVRLLASTWKVPEGGFSTDDAFRAWAIGAGVQPHEQPEVRLRELNAPTLRFQRWFQEQQRDSHRLLYPDVPLVIDVVPRVSVGSVRLAGPQADPDGETLYSDHRIVRLPDGFEPMLATEDECMNWLNKHSSDAAKDGRELRSRTLGVTMFLTTGHGGPFDTTTLRWVNSLTFTAAP